MNCANFERDEDLDFREQNLLNYLKDVSKFIVGFWMSKKDLRRSARAIAQNGINKINGAIACSDMITMRQNLKDTQHAYLKMGFGADYFELVEDETTLVISMMGDTSYEDFVSLPHNLVLVEEAIENILDKGTEMNLIRHS